MADQNIHFEDLSGGDTGERADTSAILPFSAGEQVKAAVLNRPLENLRGRSEIIRGEIEDLKYLIDTNIRWIITSGNNAGVATAHNQPMVVNRPSPVTGTFTISGTAIVIQPINTPKIDTKASAEYLFGSPPGHSSLTFNSTLYGYEQPFGGFPRGSWQRIQWSSDDYADLGARHCTVAVEGNPEHILHITVSNGTGGYTTVAELHAELDATAEMIAHGFAAVVVAGDETDTIDISTIPALYLDFPLLDTYDRELHYLTKTEIDAYFNAYGALADGDTLCIAYPFLVDPDSPTTKGGRRQATPTSSTVTPGNPNTEVTAGQLFVSSTAPGLIPMSIPLCKRVGSDLIFIDGTIFRGDETNGVYFGTSGYTNYTLSSTTLGSSGATNIGVAGHTAHTARSADKFDISAGTLQSVLEALQLFVNDKASLDTNELLGGQWIFNNTMFFIQIISPTTPFLMWRSGNIGINRPGDAQIGWETISKYQILNGTEYAYVTVQGGYLTYSSGYKIHTPATGTGNLVVTIESVGSVTGHEADHNIRGSYRRYNAAANTLYALYPTNWFTEYTLGFVSYDNAYTMWGTTLNFVATTTDILSATLNLVTPIINDLPTVDVNTVGSKRAIHPYPTLVSVNGSLGTGNHAFFNRVLEGFAVVPAALDEVSFGVYSAGRFTADTIEVTGGRAIVGGYVVTIPENRILSGVANTYLLPGTTLPSTATKTKWFGLWLRSDGVFRVGPLPVYSLNSGVPGNGLYMLPNVTYAESGKDIHDYTLVNLVWSYQGNAAGTIYFAGITHVGGNLWMYQQAQRFTAPSTWTTYVEHRFYDQYVHTGTTESDSDCADIATSYNAITAEANGLPGVPAALTTAVLLGINMSVNLTTSGNYAGCYILHNNNDTDVYSSSLIAPPVVSDPDAPVIDETYDTLLNGVSTKYGAVLWQRSFASTDGNNLSLYNRDTLLYPVGYPSAFTSNGVSQIKVGWRYDTDSGESFRFQIRTLGFMWDRYNAGGILL